MRPGDLFVDRYRLDEILGAGGTGTVWRARDTVLDRDVAVKMLRLGAPEDEVMRERLRAEARLAGGLHHPGIGQVFDFGEAHGTPFIVMQYVEGATLSSVLQERRTLPPGEVMGLVAQVADALVLAHEQGITHRDLKPANIIITGEARAVLVDFGIARSALLEPLTATGTIVGSVDYISPEQASGRSATPQSDLYSLGVMAYEALTGLRPFRRESQVASALAHLQDPAPPLPDSVPADVRALVSELMSKDPDGRPSAAADVARRAARLAREHGDLPATPAGPVDPVLPGHTTVVSPALAQPPAGRARWQRRRAWLLAPVALLLVVAAAFAATGDEPVRVPDLVGADYGTALDRLGALGLETQRRGVDDPDAERGEVLRQQPAPGEQVEPGATVVLRVATGKVELRTGRLVGEPYAAVAAAIEELGLRPVRVDVPDAAQPGTVLAISPEGRVRTGRRIEVRVAVVPPPEPTAGVEPGGGTAGGSGGGSTGGGATGGSGGGQKSGSGNGGAPGKSGTVPGRGKGKGGR